MKFLVVFFLIVFSVKSEKNVNSVNECSDLNLHNCSGVATCIDLEDGYTCRCPDQYVDGNPEEPGRICGIVFCDMCNLHGNCNIHNNDAKNITCDCFQGYGGKFCELKNAGQNFKINDYFALFVTTIFAYFCIILR
uniref:EGF-like domain-containing protein n=1 Tax=Panagrolaimus sp. ES5 TaxID=591445 RepID=A0AC34F9G9_9BILA